MFIIEHHRSVYCVSCPRETTLEIHNAQNSAFCLQFSLAMQNENKTKLAKQKIPQWFSFYFSQHHQVCFLIHKLHLFFFLLIARRKKLVSIKRVTLYFVLGRMFSVKLNELRWSVYCVSCPHETTIPKAQCMPSLIRQYIAFFLYRWLIGYSYEIFIRANDLDI